MEILIHWYAGRSKNALAGSLGVDRKTLRKYLAPAEALRIRCSVAEIGCDANPRPLRPPADHRLLG